MFFSDKQKNKSQKRDNDFFDAPDHLYYYFKNLGNDGAKNVIQQHYQNSKLASLSLAHNNLDNEIIQTIIERLIQRKNISIRTPLTELDLSGNNFTDTGITLLLDAIESEKTCQLKTLNISGNSPNKLSQSILDRTKQMMQERENKFSSKEVKTPVSNSTDNGAKKCKK